MSEKLIKGKPPAAQAVSCTTSQLRARSSMRIWFSDLL